MKIGRKFCRTIICWDPTLPFAIMPFMSFYVEMTAIKGSAGFLLLQILFAWSPMDSLAQTMITENKDVDFNPKSI
jgi:hypothetical protein